MGVVSSGHLGVILALLNAIDLQQVCSLGSEIFPWHFCMGDHLKDEFLFFLIISFLIFLVFFFGFQLTAKVHLTASK